MPPKAKKEKKNKKKPTVPLHEIDTTVLTREKLEEFCVNVYEAIKKEQNYTEFLRLDRDKLATMVAIAREQLTDIKDLILVKEHELQDAEDNHRLAMWDTRQKLNYLTCEKNTATLNSKLESVNNINQEQMNHECRMSQLLSDIQESKEKVHLYEQDFSEAKLNLEITHAENQSQIREKDREDHIVNENCREKVFITKVNKLEIEFDKEYKNVENRKNAEIAMLLKTNAKFASSLKHYYNKVVNHNLSVIDVMRADYGQLKAKAGNIEKQYVQLSEENTYLAMALHSSQKEEAQLSGQLAYSQKDQDTLKQVKMELKCFKERLEHKTIELETLNMHVDKQESLLKEQIYSKDGKMFNNRTKVEEIIVVLEFILTHLYHRNKEADSTLNKIKRICVEKGKDPEVLETIPAYQNTLVDEMNYQIAKVAQERERILGAYKAMLTKYMVHVDDTGLAIFGADDILKSAISLRVLIVE